MVKTTHGGVRISTERPEMLGTIATLCQPSKAWDEAVLKIVESLEYTHRQLAQTLIPTATGLPPFGPVNWIGRLVGE